MSFRVAWKFCAFVCVFWPFIQNLSWGLDLLKLKGPRERIPLEEVWNILLFLFSQEKACLPLCFILVWMSSGGLLRDLTHAFLYLTVVCVCGCWEPVSVPRDAHSGDEAWGGFLVHRTSQVPIVRGWPGAQGFLPGVESALQRRIEIHCQVQTEWLEQLWQPQVWKFNVLGVSWQHRNVPQERNR